MTYLWPEFRGKSGDQVLRRLGSTTKAGWEAWRSSLRGDGAPENVSFPDLCAVAAKAADRESTEKFRSYAVNSVILRGENQTGDKAVFDQLLPGGRINCEGGYKSNWSSTSLGEFEKENRD